MRPVLLIFLFLCCFFPTGAITYAEDSKRYKDFYQLGLLHIGSPKGNEYFEKSVAENPNFAPSWYWLGYESCRVGKDLEAIGYFEKYLQVAKGAEETDRIETAKEIFKELRMGRPGEEVQKIRAQE